MSYKILESHIVNDNGRPAIIAVTWESAPGYVRATYITDKPSSGYDWITPHDQISPDLLQKAARAGMNLSDDLKKKFFPGKRKWSK
jgi:hypothetical protein